MIDDIVKRSMDPCEKALKDADLTTNDHEVILVGGSTRVPLVQSLFKSFLEKNLIKV